MNIHELYPEYDYDITGTSYPGNPRSHTTMFVAKKVQHLLEQLGDVEGCLIFVQTGCLIPAGLKDRNAVVEGDNPQLEYARFVLRLQKEREEEEAKLSFRMDPQGYSISESAVIGRDCRIAPGCVIGHGVKIGDRAKIHAGCILRHAVIGDDFVCNENAVIGTDGFTMARDEQGNSFRVPCMGKVIIGDHVEIGANDSIARGSGGDTVLEDYVKLDALDYIAHDVHLHKNVMLAAGVHVGGYTEVGEHAYIGIGSTVRNRVTIGADSYIGMGAVVTKSVDPGITVVGNPARLFHK